VLLDEIEGVRKAMDNPILKRRTRTSKIKPTKRWGEKEEDDETLEGLQFRLEVHKRELREYTERKRAAIADLEERIQQLEKSQGGSGDEKSKGKNDSDGERSDEEEKKE